MPYKYRFWGLPSGVSILPRLAAIVCIQTIGRSSLLRTDAFKLFRTTNVNGTNVSSDTSFVISILLKKHRPTRTTVSCKVVWV